MNQSETAVLEGVFRSRGCTVLPYGKSVDIVVINSCTVTAAGDSDARKAVNKSCRINPLVRIAIIGCQAQVQKEQLLSWPNVCWVVGSGEKMNLADIILHASGCEGKPAVVIPPIGRDSFELPVGFNVPASQAERKRAAIKIQDGCDNFCAYCEIPFARGRSRSRSFDNVMAEASALARAGYKELVITGVNVGDYKHEGRLLGDIVAGIETFPGIERIRISSVEHTRYLLNLTKYMHAPHKLCRFLHIPVQSCCDQVLGRMGRKYVTQDIEDLVIHLLADVPGIMLGTDVIVGFPGETAEDFEMTRAFLARVPFATFHVFAYSDREKARSRLFKDAVPSAEIARRSQVLRALGREKKEAFVKGLLGQSVDVLFEQQKDDYWIGHTDNYVTIKMKSSINLKNSFRRVFLKEQDADEIIAVSD